MCCKPGFGADAASFHEVLDVIAGRASRAIIGDKAGKFGARQVFAEPAVLDPFRQAALDKVAALMLFRDASGALARIVRTLPAVVPAKTR
ncbi:hypothetical protein CEE36_05720 [candidate division TA06 bacterium B3_TA06]|uniref:Uncharacterized protein n=1 Tax=candidate division TA06 bacterium B3_TA06 TaxID=2012487 RepID=A0A532V762_UNCT6|nr:MAG: hypothetical protein CEE36_05720 [candidate division TA06 bacterium B3_TA06]